jgi:spermidine synthase
MLAGWLGNTSGAHALVLSAFMAGLGCGYALGGRLPSPSTRFPLLTYALLEAGIGALGILFPALVWVGERLGERFHGSWGAAIEHGWAVLIVLLPAIAMGATLPSVIRLGAVLAPRTGAAAALLYQANNLGACVGALGGGLVLVLWFGLSGSLGVAFALNLGAAALSLGVRLPAGLHVERPPAEEHAAASISPRFGAMVAFGLGFLALASQALWMRSFAMALGASTYSFASVAGCTIAGLAVGGGLWRAASLRNVVAGPSAVGWALVAAAIATIVPLLAFARLPYWAAQLRLAFDGDLSMFTLFFSVQLALVFAAVAPAAAASSFALSALTEAAKPPQGTRQRALGSTFAWNTVGSALGGLLASFFWMPTWGGESLGCAVALAYVVFAVGCAAAAGALRRALGGAALLTAVCISLVDPGWSAAALSAGQFRSGAALPGSFAEWARRFEDVRVLFHAEGPDATVAVTEEGHHRVLRINGKPDASTRADMVTQVLSAHVPLFLHGDASRVLVIGLGSGVTATSAALHAGAVTVVELSPAVAQAATYFQGVHAVPLSEVDVVIGDGRRALRMAAASGERPFDVIISEPSNPWIAGNGALFTAEFFRAAKESLAPGGVLAQWFHLYETTDEIVSSIAATAASEFPHAVLFELHPNDVLLVASEAPVGDMPRDFAAARATYERPEIAADLARVHVDSLPALWSRQMLGAGRFRREVVGSGRIHTDDHPFLELLAPRALFAQSRSRWLRELDARLDAADPELVATRWARSMPLSAHEHLSVFRISSLLPGGPERLRLDQLAPIAQGAEADGAADALFTLLRDGHTAPAAAFLALLEARASTSPRLDFAKACAVALQIESGGASVGRWADVREWLQRCAQAEGNEGDRCRAGLVDMERSGVFRVPDRFRGASFRP